MNKEIKTNADIKDNPFCSEYNTPFNAIPYDRITLEHFIPAVKEGIRREQENIDNICNNPQEATFENTIEEFERAGAMLGDVMCAFEALINSRSYDKIAAVAEEIHKLYTIHSNNITLNKALFARIKAVKEQAIFRKRMTIRTTLVFHVAYRRKIAA